MLVYGLLLGVVLTGLLFLQQGILGRSPFGEGGEWGDVWVAVIHALVAAYLPLAVLATVRAADENLGRSPAGRPGPSPGRSGALAVAAVVGFGLGLLGPWLTEPQRGLPHHLLRRLVG